MCGSETFEMLVSSNSMNVAIVTVSAMAHGLCLGLAPRLTQPYLGLHRHSGMQPMLGVLAGVEHDSHRQALNYLYVVTGRVFGRKKAEAIAARARQILHIALVVAAEGVDMDSDFLAAMHARELRLFEIRGHPYFVRLRHEHQGLPRFDSGSQLDATLADDAVGRRVDFRVAQVEQSLVQRRSGGIDLRFARGNCFERGACGLPI